MPIHLPPLSRRRFLASAVAAGTGRLAWRICGAAEAGVDEHRFALLADTHIAADPATLGRGINMFDHLQTVVEQLKTLERRPSQAIIAGDCAYNTGETGDYKTLTELLAPLGKAGLPVHMAMGNHDDREHFLAAFPADAKHKSPVESKLAAILETPRANWFLLDSLIKTNVSPGNVGPEQRDWLKQALDARADKPAIVVVHHNPPPEPGKTGGLHDSAELFEVLLPRKHVKALVFGHTHIWRVAEHEGLHLVNLPPVSYVSGQGRPMGWVDARLGANSMTIELRSLDPQHPDHGRPRELVWRS